MVDGETLFLIIIEYTQNNIKIKMDFKVFEAEHNNLFFRIEEDLPEVGVYLHVYEKGNCIRDFLQNDIDTCKDLAYQEYKVPLNKWIKKEREEYPSVNKPKNR